MNPFNVRKQQVSDTTEISVVRNAYNGRTWVFVYDAEAHDYVVLPNGEIIDLSVEEPGPTQYPEYRDAYLALQDSF